MQLTDKVKQYGLGLVALLLVSALSTWVAKDRTSRKLKEEFTKAFNVQVTMTAAAEQKVTETLRLAETWRREAKQAQAFKKRTVKMCGDSPCLDSKGRAIFETSEGSSSSSLSEDLQRLLETERAEFFAERKSFALAMDEKDQRITELEEKTSKHNTPSWTGKIGWDFPWSDPLKTEAGRLSIATGPKFLLGPAQAETVLKLTLPPFGTGPNGQVYGIADAWGGVAFGLDF